MAEAPPARLYRGVVVLLQLGKAELLGGITCVISSGRSPWAACLRSPEYPQATAPAALNGSVVVASPTYTSIAMEITFNRSAAEVWKRIGKYCDVSEWLQIPAGCKITSGTDSEFGAVRTVGAEVLVGRTEFSYNLRANCEGRPRSGPRQRPQKTVQFRRLLRKVV